MSDLVSDLTCGAISGIITNLITHPLDTVKCRMQTDPTTYKNLVATSIHIIKNENFIGFYKGIFANTLVNVPKFSQFMMFGQTKKFFKNYFSNKNFILFISGCVTGMSTLAYIVPLEMIKCNQQINFQGKTKKENRIIKKTQHIYRKTGIFGFYRGFFTAANRDVFSTGLYFLTYYGIKNWYKDKYKKKLNSKLKLITGGLTGLLIWVVQYPFDTIKTIIQTSNLKDKSKSQFIVMKHLYCQGGVKELYRGATPSLLLSVSSTSLTFLFFEISKNILF